MSGFDRWSRDQRLMLFLSAGVFLLVLIASVVAPASGNRDPRPSTYNNGPAGVRAAYLTLERLGRPVERWDRPLEELPAQGATETTLVLAAPVYPALDRPKLAEAVRTFLSRGGRVVTTGQSGALLLPGGAAEDSRRFGTPCMTQPEGPGALAAAGSVEIDNATHWSADQPATRVEQRCGSQAVVVRLRVGSGEAIWWSSPSPMTNAELHNDADLRLLLASLGSNRRLLFCESLFVPVRSPWTAARGLPVWALLWQVVLVFALLVFSFSRRRGPVRVPVRIPRSSPLEFARSMGSLYARGGATGTAIESARRQLGRVLETKAGLSTGTLAGGGTAIVPALNTRFGREAGGSWKEIGEHWDAALAFSDPLAPHVRAGAALRLAQALARDEQRVHAAVRSRTGADDRAAASADPPESAWVSR